MREIRLYLVPAMPGNADRSCHQRVSHACLSGPGIVRPRPNPASRRRAVACGPAGRRAPPNIRTDGEFTGAGGSFCEKICRSGMPGGRATVVGAGATVLALIVLIVGALKGKKENNANTENREMRKTHRKLT